MQNSSYDVVIVGAGPGGSVCARFCALQGLSVLLLEKRAEVGIPVRCGEATGSRERLSLYGPISEDTIETDLNGVIVYGTGGRKVKLDMPGVGLMLDRTKFDPYYAELAVQAGAELVCKARVSQVSEVKSGERAVQVELDGESITIQAKMVVAADGAESLIGRMVGIKTRQLPNSTCSAIELKLDVLCDDPDCLTMWHGHDYINEGYLWAFPKVKAQQTNFGAGFMLPKLGSKNIHDVTEEYRQRFYPESKVLDVYGGAVPVSGTLETTVLDHFLLVGDAAHHTNPLTGGGIAAAMNSGKQAATIIKSCLDQNDLSAQALKQYEKICWTEFGRQHEKVKRFRDYMNGLNRQEQEAFYDVVKVAVEQGKWMALLKHPINAVRTAWGIWKEIKNIPK